MTNLQYYLNQANLYSKNIIKEKMLILKLFKRILNSLLYICIHQFT